MIEDVIQKIKRSIINFGYPFRGMSKIGIIEVSGCNTKCSNPTYCIKVFKNLYENSLICTMTDFSESNLEQFLKLYIEN